MMRELVASAVNSGNLAQDPEHQAKVDVLTALGFTNHEATVLWRLKYGHDHDSLKPAAYLLVKHARERGPFQHWRIPTGGDIFLRFVGRALHEWLNERCAACHGTGVRGTARGSVLHWRNTCKACGGRGTERVPALLLSSVLSDPTTGPPIARSVVWQRHAGSRPCAACNGAGVKARTTQLAPDERSCLHCNGTGLYRSRASERARAMGIELKRYHRLWVKPFDWMAQRLGYLDQAFAGPLRRAFLSDNVRPAEHSQERQGRNGSQQK